MAMLTVLRPVGLIAPDSQQPPSKILKFVSGSSTPQAQPLRIDNMPQYPSVKPIARVAVVKPAALAEVKKAASPAPEVTDDDDTAVQNEIAANLRTSLKVVRDPCKNAFDLLPTGETIGAFANKHAVDRYIRKVENKRERARETRRKKRKVDA